MRGEYLSQAGKAPEGPPGDCGMWHCCAHLIVSHSRNPPAIPDRGVRCPSVASGAKGGDKQGTGSPDAQAPVRGDLTPAGAHRRPFLA